LRCSRRKRRRIGFRRRLGLRHRHRHYRPVRRGCQAFVGRASFVFAADGRALRAQCKCEQARCPCDLPGRARRHGASQAPAACPLICRLVLLRAGGRGPGLRACGRCRRRSRGSP